MAASDAIPVPRKNTAFRMTFPVYDTSGALKSSLASADSEVSLDGAAFADCTNEVTEIGSTGFYYIDLTSGEMNADTVAYKLTGTGINTLTAIIYPEEAGDYRAAVTSIGAGVITAASIDTGAIDADALAADAVTEIQSGLATAAALATVDGVVDSILLDTAEIGAAGAGLTALATAANLAIVDTVVDGIATTLGTPAGASISADIAAIESQTDDIGTAGAGLTAIPWNAAWDAEVQSEVTDALNAYDPPTKAELDSAVAPLATAANLATVAGYLDTEIAAILEDTGTTLPASIASLDSLIDAIKLVTDALPNSGALTDLATAAALATVEGNVDAILVDTDTTIPGLIAALNDLAGSDILTTALVESYSADGAAPTLSQAIFLILQFLYERVTAGTTVTVKKLDGTTTAATLTLDSGTTPTSITRAT